MFDWVGSVRWDNVQQGRTVVIHMCPLVKARESVGRLAKLAVRPWKFATHKKTHDFEYK